MNRKLSIKERDELVTKGFLVEYVEEVLEQKLEEKLEKKLEEKLNEKLAPYATREFVMEAFETSRKAFNEDMSRQISTLIEESSHKFQILIEAFVDRTEKLGARISSVEDRTTVLEKALHI